jgi:hypothetical protein
MAVWQYSNGEDYFGISRSGNVYDCSTPGIVAQWHVVCACSGVILDVVGYRYACDFSPRLYIRCSFHTRSSSLLDSAVVVPVPVVLVDIVIVIVQGDNLQGPRGSDTSLIEPSTRGIAAYYSATLDRPDYCVSYVHDPRTNVPQSKHHRIKRSIQLAAAIQPSFRCPDIHL